jgi:hypothetical protein
LLTKVSAQLEECLKDKDVCVDKRLEKHNTVLEIITAVKKFEENEKNDSETIKIKRESYLALITEMRNLSEKLSSFKIESQYLESVSQSDKTLNQERQALILQNLMQALADATHHLYWLQHRNKLELDS